MPSKILVEQIAHTNDTSAIDIDSSGNMVLQKELKFGATGAIKNSAGNAILQESGGNVTLSNVRLPASGGISDSSGNSVLTESGGNVSIGNVRLPASGGISDSSGNAIISESSGAVTIGNSTFANTNAFPAGHVIQFESTGVTTSFVGANNTKNSWRDLTPMTVTLNNKISTSKCFIWAVVNMSLRDNYTVGIRLVRRVNTTDTPIAINTNSSSGIKGTTNIFTLPSYGSENQAGFPIMWMDTTSATSVTYKLQYFIPNIAVANFYLNQNETTTNGNSAHGVSSISVMEIAQ